MKSILFVLYDYYPFESANTSCVEVFINKLLEHKHNIHILTRKMDDSDTQDERNIFRVNDKFMIYNIRLKNFIKKFTNKYIKKLITLGIYFIRFVMLISHNIYIKIFKISKLDKAMVDQIIMLYKTYKYDIIITVSVPFSCQLSGAKAKDIIGEKVNLVPFILDPYTYNSTLSASKRKKNRRLKVEKYTLDRSTIIFTTNELYNENKKNEFCTYINKTIPLSYANLRPIKYDINNSEEFVKDKKYIECIYTGSLYTDIRNPKFMFELIKNTEINIRLHLYTHWKDKMLDYYKNILGNKLVIHGYKDKNSIYNAMEKCDILFNIGNTISNQIPSKIFDYMSCGKPIVNLYTIDDDPTLNYLEKYPMKINIKQNYNDYEMSKEQFIDFCTLYKGSTMTFEEATINMKNFTSEYITEYFANIIENI